MARRGSFFAGLERAARAAARAQREAAAAERRRARDQVRLQHETLRLQQVRERLARQQHFVSRQDEAIAMTSDLAAQVDALRGILDAREFPTQEGIFGSLRVQDQAPVLTIPSALERAQPVPEPESYVRWVRPLAWWEKIFQYRTRYERDLHGAEERYRADHDKWQQAEETRVRQVEEVQRRYEQELGAYHDRVLQRERDIHDLRQRYEHADPDAIITVFEIVLDQSVWPDEFLQEYRVAYEPGAKQLVIDYELPTVGVVPAVAEYKYVKTKNAIEEKPRKPAEIKEVYRDVVAAIALRCIHECFTADAMNHVDVLALNGFVNTTDPATGNPIRPYLISVRVTKERFNGIVLDRVDTKACLRNLGAQVSPQPAELVAVKPIIEFDMVDKRFIGDKDILSDLDARPNLMDLTPAEFEALAGNLFTRMGLETKLTRTNRDGGVDAIAYDTRPILGGKVVIQAKRCRHTVGVSAVRDLSGP